MASPLSCEYARCSAIAVCRSMLTPKSAMVCCMRRTYSPWVGSLPAERAANTWPLCLRLASKSSSSLAGMEPNTDRTACAKGCAWS